MILRQNETLNDFKVTFVKKGINGQNTIFGECSSLTYGHLMYEKRIFIGWDRLPVFEDLSVSRCFQCQEFYHKKQNCMH